MRQTIHIFKKDVRHLWPAILAVLLITGVFAHAGAISSGASRWAFDDPYTTWTALLALFGWWYLIAAAIHEEALPGHQQYWLTRPYSWKSLLAAKALFILAFVNVPKLIADCVIVEGQGLRAASYWSGLLTSQVMLTAVWLLPYAAIAAVTRNLRQVILAVVLVWAVLIMPSFFISRYVLFDTGRWHGAEWIRNLPVIAILLIASLIIVLWQYSRRRTAVARVLAVSAMIPIFGIPALLPDRALTELQKGLLEPQVDTSPIGIAVDSIRNNPEEMGFGSSGNKIRIEIPLRVTALPEGTDLYSFGVAMEIEGPDGPVLRDKYTNGLIYEKNDGFWESVHIDSEELEQLQGKSITIRNSASFAVIEELTTTRIEPGERGTVVPGVGICRSVEQQNGTATACFTPFRRSPFFVKTLISEGTFSPWVEAPSYSPFPSEAGISPLVISSGGITSSGPRFRPAIVTERLLALFDRDFEIRGVLLEHKSGAWWILDSARSLSSQK